MVPTVQPKKIKRIAKATRNQCENFEDDDLDKYGDYTNPWKLDCGATTDHFAGKRSGVRKRKNVKKGFDVMVANGDKIMQQEEGIIPFNVPTTAVNVTIFDKMPNALLAAGPLVKVGCYIILDTPQAKVIDKKMGKVILTAEFEPWSATWDAYPSWEQTNKKGPIQHEANNAYRDETKKELIAFYPKAAGHPVKKTWMAAIKHGAYASWPELTEKLVQRFLYKQEVTIMGHMHARKLGVQSTTLKITKLPTGTEKQCDDDEEDEFLE